MVNHYRAKSGLSFASKAVPLHAKEAYGGRGSITPFILNLYTGWSWVPSFTPWPLYFWWKAFVPNEQYARRYPDPVRTLQRKNISCLCQEKNQDFSAVTVNVLTKLFRLHMFGRSWFTSLQSTLPPTNFFLLSSVIHLISKLASTACFCKNPIFFRFHSQIFYVIFSQLS